MTSLYGFNPYCNQCSEEEQKLIVNKLVKQEFKAGDFWLTEGDTCLYFGYMTKGVMRTCFEDGSGKKSSLFFHFADKPITELESFVFKKPSKYSIECIADATIYAMTYEDREFLMKTIPGFERAMRLMIEDIFLLTSERMVNQVVLTAKERYLHLIDKNPKILFDLSLGNIAEYINIKPQSLSRIRKNMSRHI